MHRVTQAGTLLVDWVLLPAAVLHELTHLLPVLPWLERVNLQLAGRASVKCELRPDAPRWARRLAAVAPTLVGALAACIVYIAVLAGGQVGVMITIEQGLVVEAGLRPVAWALGTAWWYWYTLPSARDREAFMNPD